jgi:hypothetical protein
MTGAAAELMPDFDEDTPTVPDDPTEMLDDDQ